MYIYELYEFHGEESFLRNHKSLGYSRISQNLINPNFHYSIHKSLPLVPILRQINPIHITPPYFCKIHFNIIFLLVSFSFWWLYLMKSTSYKAPHAVFPTSYSSLFSPHNPLNALFSNTLSPHSSFSVTDQVSRSYKTADKLVLYVYFNFYSFRQEMIRQKVLNWLVVEFNLLLISSWIKFSIVTVIPKYFNFATFSKDLLTIFTLWFCHAFWWRDINLYYTNVNSIHWSFCVSLYSIEVHHQHTAEADVSHSVSVPPKHLIVLEQYE
jgi:hypothetical protein